jgi:DNA mismatch repair protein MutS2
LIQSETLELLEWSRLCQHLATFAATKLGAIAARHLPIPATQAESEELLEQTQAIYELESSLSSGLSFEGIEDIGNSLERAALQGILSGVELLAIATTLAGMRRLNRTIDEHSDRPVLLDLIATVRTYPELEQEIHHSIDDSGEVADRASPKLSGIRSQLKDVRNKIQQALQSILQRQSSAIQQPLITQRGDRFVIPIKADRKDAIPGIVHDTSGSGATLYVEPYAISSLGNQLRQYQRQEQIEAEAIRRALSERVAEVKPDLEQLLAVATTLDLATAKARYSLWLEANPPRFIDPQENERITLRQLRHPLLVWQQIHEQGAAVVPVNLLISPQIRVVTITGPNTGGKTVTLKTLGLAALMAKVGLFVPAREPVELPWFEQILADIGDEQSLQQNLSTFSGHIRRISRIIEAIESRSSGVQEFRSSELRIQNSEFRSSEILGAKHLGDNISVGLESFSPNASPASPTGEVEDSEQEKFSLFSLVLLDEVGAGTDPAEGSALAIALLKHLADTARLTVATTHYGELKALKYEDDRFENAAVEFDDVSLAPTYRILWGIPGRSNALSVARRLGLKSAVVDAAQGLIGGTAEEIDQVISGLESQRREQETKAREAALLLQQAEKLHEEVERQASDLKARERELKQRQEQAVMEAIAQAKSEIAKVIRQLQQGPMTAQDAQKATDALKEISDRRLPVTPPPQPKKGFQPEVGSRVRIPKLGQTAEVLSAANDDGELTVRFGLMKMTVSLADVESLQGEKAVLKEREGERERGRAGKDRPLPPSPPPPLTPTPAIQTSQNTVDIRGMRVADAESKLERAINQAANAGVLWIIHGKGTGRLREGVHELLQKHPQIKNFRLADRSDGGSGVTIAYTQ